MNLQSWNKFIVWFLILLVSSCVEPYTPEILEAPNSYLVVNGFINANGITTIRLGRTQNVYEEGKPPVETQAIVKIESESGEQFGLYESSEGTYTSDDLKLDIKKKYRLFIRANSGKEYASDFVEVKQTPPIDAVDWKAVNGEVQLFVSTHDASNKTKYYRWEFEHTWQYRAAFFSLFKYENGEVVFRTNNDENIYNCWKTEKSTTIELSNSLALSQDVISNYKLFAIPYNSEMIGIKYSMLVKQYALSQEAYKYWEILKKNTESIGTLFDPLPSQLTSNIKCLSNPDELVVGFVYATTSQEKRILIDRMDLPKEWRTFIPTCPADTMLLSKADPAEYFAGGYFIPVDAIYPDGSPFPIGYIYSSKACVDCRVRGTNVKPSYW